MVYKIRLNAARKWETINEGCQRNRGSKLPALNNIQIKDRTKHAIKQYLTYLKNFKCMILHKMK
jgi:glutathione peroxidase-family protein